MVTGQQLLNYLKVQIISRPVEKGQLSCKALPSSHLAITRKSSQPGAALVDRRCRLFNSVRASQTCHWRKVVPTLTLFVVHSVASCFSPSCGVCRTFFSSSFFHLLDTNPTVNTQVVVGWCLGNVVVETVCKRTKKKV